MPVQKGEAKIVVAHIKRAAQIGRALDARRQLVNEAKRAFVGAALDAVEEFGIETQAERLGNVFFDVVAHDFIARRDGETYFLAQIGLFELQHVAGALAVDFEQAVADLKAEFVGHRVGFDFADGHAARETLAVAQIASGLVAVEAMVFVFLDLIFVFLHDLRLVATPQNPIWPRFFAAAPREDVGV